MSAPMRVARRRAWWLPVVQGWLIGLVFITVYLAAFHAPRLRAAALAVAPGRQASALTAELRRRDLGAFSLRGAPSVTAALAAVRHDDVLAAVLPARPAAVLYAGANGPTAHAALLATLVPAVSAALHSAPVVRDVDPARPQDSAGLSLFYLTFGTVLASYLFAIAAVTLGAELSPAAHWANAALAAALLGITVAFLAGPGFGVVPVGDAATVGVVIALLSLAVSGTTAMLLTLSRSFGTLIGTITLLTLGTASAGSLPPALLPGWARLAREVLANGLALEALRGVVYFSDHALTRGLLGLAAWVVVPVVVLQTLSRHLTRQEA